MKYLIIFLLSFYTTLQAQDTISIFNTNIAWMTPEYGLEIWDDGEVILRSCDTAVHIHNEQLAESIKHFMRYVNKQFLCVDPLGDYLHTSYWYIKENPELKIIVVKWQRLNGEFGPVYYEYPGSEVDLFHPVFDHNLGTYVFTEWER